MMEWLRTSKVAAGLLTLIRLYVGWQFLSAGWEKIAGPKSFDASAMLKNASKLATGAHPQVQHWYANFISGFALPHVGLFNFLVQYGEVLVGLGLILGTLTTLAAFFALVMNFSYLFAGSVSTNPNLILLSFFIVAAGFNAGLFGGDYFVMPRLSALFSRKKESNASQQLAV